MNYGSFQKFLSQSLSSILFLLIFIKPIVASPMLPLCCLGAGEAAKTFIERERLIEMTEDVEAVKNEEEFNTNRRRSSQEERTRSIDEVEKVDRDRETYNSDYYMEQQDW